MGSGTNWAKSATGGSAGAYKAIISVTRKVDATLVVGAGGISYGFEGGPHMTVSGSGTPGEDSIIYFNGEEMISAGGGKGGNASSHTGGDGGIVIISDTLNVEQEYIHKNGTKGNSINGAGGVSGVPGPISGHTWGSSSSASGSYGGGSSGPSKNGYILIKYLGPLED